MKLKDYFVVSAIITVLLAMNTYIVLSLFPYKPTEKIDPHKMAGKLLWHGNGKLPEIALTFDDGPNTKFTPRVLDILKKNKVKATFFVLGSSAAHEQNVLSREAIEGHNIGNHTYNHVKGTMTELQKIKRELSSTDAIITKATSKPVRYFRPPFGFQNWRFFAEAEAMDYTIVLWSIDVGDWDKAKTEEYMVSKITKLAKNGSIILLHDGGSNRDTVIAALPHIIANLRKKGLEFVTIDKMIAHLKD